MKKLLLLTITLFCTFSWSILCSAETKLIAQVKLQEDLKPKFAAGIPEGQGAGRAGTVNLFLQLIAGSLIYIAGPVAVLIIAVGGLRYVISRGDQNEMEGAKKTIMWAIIGLLVIIISYTIVSNVITLITPIGKTGSDTIENKK